MAKKRSKRITAKNVQATEDQPFVMPSVPVKPETDSDAWDNDGLTIRNRLFVEAIVGPAGGNATEAARMAGYRDDNIKSLQVTASQILSRPMVQEAIARALARKRMTPAWAQERLLEIASSSMRNFVEQGPDGQLVTNWEKAFAHGAIGQVAEIREELFKIGDGPAETIKRTFKLHNPTRALETLLKLSGALVERHDVNVTMDLSQLSDDDLHRLREIHAKASGHRSFAGSN